MGIVERKFNRHLYGESRVMTLSSSPKNKGASFRDPHTLAPAGDPPPLARIGNYFSARADEVKLRTKSKHAPTRRTQTVQARIMKCAQEIGWTYVPRGEAERRRGFDPADAPLADVLPQVAHRNAKEDAR
jgi:hypothetical protein